jgi:sirohydrochlorin ferrochelatase
MRPLPPALVVVGHGSADPRWVATFRAFVADVAATPGVRDVFASVTAAFLEEALPGLADAVDSQLALGVSEVIVVPVFLTVSTHLGEDVPGILGLPGTPPHIARRLAGEGIRTLPEGLPVRLAPLGDVRHLLHLNISRRLALQSRDRAHEAVVLVAYGSTIHHEQWEDMLHALRAALLTDGWSSTHHAYCGHIVQLSPEPTADAICAVAHHAGVRAVHVVPLLFAPSGLQTGPIARGVALAAERLERQRVAIHYAADAILPDGDLAARAGHAALRACGVTPPFIARGLRNSAGDA